MQSSQNELDDDVVENDPEPGPARAAPDASNGGGESPGPAPPENDARQPSKWRSALAKAFYYWTLSR